MKNYVLLLVVVVLMPLIGNSTSRILVNGKEYNGECADILQNVELVDLSSIETDQVGVRDVKIEGDCLVIAVNYGGGCGTTNFELISNGQVINTLRPGVELFLRLEDNDFCKAIKYTELKFDISPFRNLKTEYGLVFRIVGTDFSIVWE